MIKQIIAGFCLLLSAVAFSQENNASPYSFYGIGDAKFKGTAENRSMGGLGILPDSIHLNLQNPATYSSLKLTTFTLSGSTSKTTLKTDTDKADAGRTTADYIALALPFKKLGIAFGLMPYTATGYKIENYSAPDPTDGYRRFRQFDGSGGINRVFAGASYNITKGFAIGADFDYYFGKVETQNTVGIPDAIIQYATRETNTTDYHGVGFNVGATYQTLLNKKYIWTASATFRPEMTLKGGTDRTIATISQTTNGGVTVIDSQELRFDNDDNTMPMRVTGGTGIGVARKWFAGVEYTFTDNESLTNRFTNISNATFEKGQKISVGGYYIPKFYSFTSYLSRITYRAGLRYEKTGLVINNESINDMAVSLGVGLPMNGIGGSNINIGVEYGQRGTKNAGLIQENYFNLFVSLSLNDKWFVKRKYD